MKNAKMLDRMHQAIGRNSGYRWDGYQSVVLVDPQVHRYLVEQTRYFIDQGNSVLIDRTKDMSRKDRRTTDKAPSLVREVERLLNDIDSYIRDNRKIKPDINHVVKSIENVSDRLSFISRLLLALTSLSDVRFDSRKNSTPCDNSRQRMYRELGQWLINKWVPEDNLNSVLEEYKKELR